MRRRRVAMAVAFAIGGLATPGSVWADEPIEPEPTVPTGAGAPSPDDQIDVGAPPAPPMSDEPRVAVGLPPVPPTTAAPTVTVEPPPVLSASVPSMSGESDLEVGRAPVPPAALLATVDAALDLVRDCL